MAPNDIAKKLRRQPFQPMRVFLSDGSSYDVHEPYHAYMEVTEMHIGLDPDATGIPTRTAYCGTRHVTRIEPLLASSESGGNGHR